LFYLKNKQLVMPAKTEKQRRLMGAALAYKKEGKIKKQAKR